MIKIFKTEVKVFMDLRLRGYAGRLESFVPLFLPTVEYEEKLWLFLQWEDRKEPEYTIPRKIILHNDRKFDDYQENNQFYYDNPLDYELKDAAPISVLDGQNPNAKRMGYKIIDHPNIPFRFGEGRS